MQPFAQMCKLILEFSKLLCQLTLNINRVIIKRTMNSIVLDKIIKPWHIICYLIQGMKNLNQKMLSTEKTKLIAQINSGGVV